MKTVYRGQKHKYLSGQGGKLCSKKSLHYYSIRHSVYGSADACGRRNLSPSRKFHGAYMYADVWNAVGGLFSLMPGSRLCGGLCRLSEPNHRCSLVYRLCRIGIYQRDQRLVDRHGCAAYPILHILYQRECRRL